MEEGSLYKIEDLRPMQGLFMQRSNPFSVKCSPKSMNATWRQLRSTTYLHAPVVYTKPRKSITESRLTHLPRAGNIKRQIRISLDVIITFGPIGHSLRYLMIADKLKCPDPKRQAFDPRSISDLC